MTTHNDLILSSWGDEDEESFFDPVYGDNFDPQDELPWLIDAVTKPATLPSLTAYVGKVERVDPMEDQHNARWSMDV